MKSHMKPVRERFGAGRAIRLNSSQVNQFVAERLREGAALATVNRGVQILRQAFNLARKEGYLMRAPYFALSKENNARQGFFEADEFDALVRHLPEPIADIAWFAYLSAWRRGEIVPLRWSAVDRHAGEVRLHTSKSGHGRVLPLDGILSDVIERRWAAREYEAGPGVTALSEFVFHKRGRAIVEFKKSWASACKKAGVPGKLFHDLRRTAIRNMVRAGVPQSVVMSISGHRTISTFLRYNITSDEDRRDAIRKTETYVKGAVARRGVLPMARDEAAE